jgi:hypothetical protein
MFFPDAVAIPDDELISGTWQSALARPTLAYMKVADLSNFPCCRPSVHSEGARIVSGTIDATPGIGGHLSNTAHIAKS